MRIPVTFSKSNQGLRLDLASENLIDILCPSFSESGYVVQCEPVGGYPLKIIADSSNQVRFAVVGKNLYNSEVYPLDAVGYVRYDSGSMYVNNPSSSYRVNSKLIPAAHLRGQKIAIRNAPAITNGNSTSAGVVFLTDGEAYISGTNKDTITVPDNASYMRFTINKEYVNEAQIEIGSTVTDYEKYVERGIEADHPVELKAFSGINNVYAYDHDQPVSVTVTGKSDIATMIDKLTQAVISLGGNI